MNKSKLNKVTSLLDILEQAEELEWFLSPTYGDPNDFGFCEDDYPMIESVLLGMEKIKDVTEKKLKDLEMERLKKWNANIAANL